MQDFDAVEFADRLAAMTDEEVFGLMEELEEASETIRPEDRDDSDVFAQIALVETAIEDRFPGQLMAPYKDWQQRRVGG
ncbi:hypothetical protein [Agrobacterium tumefaciens]|uniref:hypothetical protein n=1 Tax=Agrobacterium tumefaciens TaxID=358 RepID=UPI001CBD8DA5|nr:hypothetical protein [Agrobacterium tumefaciens]